MAVSRRRFLSAGIRAGLAAPLLGVACRSGSPIETPTAPATPTPSPGSDLAALYPDLRRHFIFEYYPWYGGPPGYRHWEQFDRVPPLDLASNYMPRLGAYDSRSAEI